jgi:hypothetical protein
MLGRIIAGYEELELHGEGGARRAGGVAQVEDIVQAASMVQI